MKKSILIIITILVISFVAFGATACNNATTEGQLENVFFNLQNGAKELYEYSVIDSSTNSTGTYSLSIVYYDAGNTVVVSPMNSITKCNKGYLITSHLTMSDGYVSDASCYFAIASVSGVSSSFLKPIAAYKKVTGSSHDYQQYGTYEGKEYNYTLEDLTTSTSSENKITVGTNKVYDNNEFHQVLRGINSNILNSGTSFAFVVPIITPTETITASITASVSSRKEEITTEVLDSESKKKSFDAYSVTLSRSTKVTGITQSLYYAVEDTDYDGFKIVHMLLKIVEGNVTYTLKNYSLSL